MLLCLEMLNISGHIACDMCQIGTLFVDLPCFSACDRLFSVFLYLARRDDTFFSLIKLSDVCSLLFCFAYKANYLCRSSKLYTLEQDKST